MRQYRIGQAATLLGVSADTVRRWVDGGRLHATRTAGGQRLVSGAELAALASSLKPESGSTTMSPQSTRNRFVGIVTAVTRDKVMTQVEVQAGTHRFVSLISREAADELELEPGVLVAAAVKATNVAIELLDEE
jgi:molybdopterin-binding protein